MALKKLWVTKKKFYKGKNAEKWLGNQDTKSVQYILHTQGTGRNR